MEFSAEEKKEFERRYQGIHVTTRLLHDYPKYMPFTVEEHPRAWQRLEQIATMSREELMGEIEADYLLFESIRVNPEGSELVGLRKFEE
jgi:hypothetical protein